jgi:hypothetical protein
MREVTLQHPRRANRKNPASIVAGDDELGEIFEDLAGGRSWQRLQVEASGHNQLTSAGLCILEGAIGPQQLQQAAGT